MQVVRDDPTPPSDRIGDETASSWCHLGSGCEEAVVCGGGLCLPPGMFVSPSLPVDRLRPARILLLRSPSGCDDFVWLTAKAAIDQGTESASKLDEVRRVPVTSTSDSGCVSRRDGFVGPPRATARRAADRVRIEAELQALVPVLLLAGAEHEVACALHARPSDVDVREARPAAAVDLSTDVPANSP